MATPGPWRPLDDVFLEAAVNELAFLERVRLEAVSGRFAQFRYSSSDGRQQTLTIRQKLVSDPLPPDSNDGVRIGRFRFKTRPDPPQRLFFRVKIKRQKEQSQDCHKCTVKEVEGLKQMLYEVFLREKNWRQISVKHVDFGQNRVIPILSRLSAVETVFDFSASFFGASAASEEIEKLATWIKKYSPQLHRLTLSLFGNMEAAAGEKIVEAIGQCQKLRRLKIGGRDIEQVATFPDMLLQLPKLASFACLRDFSPLSAKSLLVDEHWLAVFAQPSFESLLGRMKHFVLCHDSYQKLPLPPAIMMNVVKVTSAMKWPVEMVIFADIRQQVSLDKVLTDWLLLARDTQANILLKTSFWCPSVASYIAAMSALPADLQDGRLRMPTIDDIGTGGEDQLLTFSYVEQDQDGGQVMVDHCRFDAAKTGLSLKLLCERHLLRSLTLANACRFFKVASTCPGMMVKVGRSKKRFRSAKQCNSASLKMAAGRLIGKNYETAKASADWQKYIHENFVLMSVEEELSVVMAAERYHH